MLMGSHVLHSVLQSLHLLAHLRSLHFRKQGLHVCVPYMVPALFAHFALFAMLVFGSGARYKRAHICPQDVS